jgi:hypothetical protein
MRSLTRILRVLRARFGGPIGVPPAAAPELWCRPATVLALRDPARAGACLAGWR